MEKGRGVHIGTLLNRFSGLLQLPSLSYVLEPAIYLFRLKTESYGLKFSHFLMFLRVKDVRKDVRK